MVTRESEKKLKQHFKFRKQVIRNLLAAYIGLNDFVGVPMIIHALRAEKNGDNLKDLTRKLSFKLRTFDAILGILRYRLSHYS